MEKFKQEPMFVTETFDLRTSGERGIRMCNTLFPANDRNRQIAMDYIVSSEVSEMKALELRERALLACLKLAYEPTFRQRRRRFLNVWRHRIRAFFTKREVAA